jgi:hypothetical protein
MQIQYHTKKLTNFWECIVTNDKIEYIEFNTTNKLYPVPLVFNQKSSHASTCYSCKKL